MHCSAVHRKAWSERYCLAVSSLTISVGNHFGLSESVVSHAGNRAKGLIDLKGQLKKSAQLLYGVGIHLIIRCRSSIREKIDLKQYVDSLDNQWAIFQSIFLIDISSGTFEQARTWSQVVTGKYQDRISEILSQQYKEDIV
jgi:hypothetical protein